MSSIGDLALTSICESQLSVSILCISSWINSEALLTMAHSGPFSLALETRAEADSASARLASIEKDLPPDALIAETTSSASCLESR